MLITSDSSRRRPSGQRLLLASLVVGGALVLSAETSQGRVQSEAPASAASVDALSPFAPNDAASPKVIDHQPLSSFIETFSVAEAGRRTVNFGAARGRGADFIAAYVKFLSTFEPSTLRDDEKLAYWLNLRNALVLHTFSDKGGGNLKKLRGAFDAPGEGWTRKQVTVEGAELSIDDIERGIILKHWRDPMVLYGLYQASPSGPQLFERAFAGASVWTDLRSLGVKYANSGGAARVRGETLQLASIYGWCRPSLFGDQDAQVQAHIAELVAERLRTKVQTATTVTYAPFSYRLEKFEPRAVVSRELETSPSPGFPSGS